MQQTLARLSDKLLMRWSEYSLRMRKKEEPNLIHLEEWLQDRVMASRDSYLPQNRGRNLTTLQTSSWKEASTWSCPCCKQNHLLFKCERYKEKTDNQKLSFVKQHRLCFNRLSNSHSVRECLSELLQDWVQEKHHASIHDSLSSENSKETLVKIQPQQASVTPPKLFRMTKGNRSVYLQIIPLKVNNYRRL